MNVRAGLCGFSFALILTNSHSALAQPTNLDSYVCEGEKSAFDEFIRQAVKNGLNPAYEPPVKRGVERVERLSRDGLRLRGYLAKARDRADKLVSPKGYVLVLLGNAMFAEHIIEELIQLSSGGLDIFAFDYRGYGLSEGAASVKGLVDDARQLVKLLGSPEENGGAGYSKRSVYGVSAGAAVAVAAFNTSSPLDKLVLDGTPARISLDVRFLGFIPLLKLTCPTNLDPVNNPMALAAKSLFIVGLKDRVIRNTQNRADQRQFLNQICKTAAKVVVKKQFAHPFQDQHTVERLELANRFFLDGNLTADTGC